MRCTIHVNGKYHDRYVWYKAEGSIRRIYWFESDGLCLYSHVDIIPVGELML